MNKKILFITHDCTLTGAPLVLQSVIDHVKGTPNVESYVACINQSYLSQEGYNYWKEHYNCFKLTPIKKKANNLAQIALIKSYINPDVIYGNTILTIPYFVLFKKVDPNIKTVLHIHENNDVYHHIESELGKFDSAFEYIDKFIVVSQWQVENLISTGVPLSKIFYTPACINTKQIDRFLLKKKIDYPKVRIIGIGTPSMRKGLDRFIEVAKCFNPDQYEFVWIGGCPKKLDKGYVQVCGHNTYHDEFLDGYPVKFMDELSSVYSQIHQSDIFLLLSREDPCPLVMLESLYLGLGAITIKSSGDSYKYCTPYDVVLEEYDINEVVKSIHKLIGVLKDPTVRFYKNIYYRQLKSQISEEIVCKNIYDQISPYLQSQLPLEHLNSKITYVFVDDIYTDRCLKIIQDYESYGITNIKLFTSKDIQSKYLIKIDPITSSEKYSEFILKHLNEYITTDYCIISQWDGFIINPTAWDDEFFNYDYIGAPWFWKYNNVVGGNGGFSLRSKKLMNVVQYIPYDNTTPEDHFICETHGKSLVKNGFKFPSVDLAKKFSVENEISNGSFGFHNFTTENIIGAEKYYHLKFHHSGDLGDLIYGLPFIRQKGGGVLILSADYSKMPARSPMNYDKAMSIRELFRNIDYLYDVQFSLKLPVDIDYDMNDFRNIFIKWGEGRYTKEEEVEVSKIKLTDLYRLCIDPTIDMNFDKTAWLKFDPILLNGKSIVINRTNRYNNKNFPWKKIVNDYKDKIIFVGSPEEHKLFVDIVGEVDYYPTHKLIDLAKIISGCKLFIGNQSFPYSLAEGMKKNCIQETSSDLVPNCLFERQNAYLTLKENSTEYSKIKNFIEMYV